MLNLSTLQGQELLLVNKALESGDFIGSQGLLTRDQFRQYLLLVKRHASIFGAVTTKTMTQRSMDFPKLHFGRPITKAVGENSNPAQDNKPLSNLVHLDAQKTRSQMDITTEVMQNNVEQSDFDMTVMQGATARIARDLALLAMMGDTDLVPAVNDDHGQLLVANDGWFKLARGGTFGDGGHELDVGGNFIDPGLFAAMIDRMPDQYRGDTGLRFIVGSGTVLDWQTNLAGRGTPLGDRAIGESGASATPWGIPLLVDDTIPRDLLLPITSESTAASLQGVVHGPFEFFTGLNNTLTIAINGGAALVITLNLETSEGQVLETRQVVNQINAAFRATVPATRAIAYDNGEGLVTIRTIDKGVVTAIAITATGVAPDASSTLGFGDGTPGTVSAAGVDSGTAGAVREGTFIILTNPRNLWWAMLDQTRMFVRFNEEYDRVDMLAYHQTDAAIENPDALVLATNVRRTSHVAGSLP
jgi:hypothetical protein